MDRASKQLSISSAGENLQEKKLQPAHHLANWHLTLLACLPHFLVER